MGRNTRDKPQGQVRNLRLQEVVEIGCRGVQGGVPDHRQGQGGRPFPERACPPQLLPEQGIPPGIIPHHGEMERDGLPVQVGAKDGAGNALPPLSRQGNEDRPGLPEDAKRFQRNKFGIAGAEAHSPEFHCFFPPSGYNTFRSHSTPSSSRRKDGRLTHSSGTSTIRAFPRPEIHGRARTSRSVTGFIAPACTR